MHTAVAIHLLYTIIFLFCYTYRISELHAAPVIRHRFLLVIVMNSLKIPDRSPVPSDDSDAPSDRQSVDFLVNNTQLSDCDIATLLISIKSNLRCDSSLLTSSSSLSSTHSNSTKNTMFWNTVLDSPLSCGVSKIHHCQHCGRKFKQRGALRSHIRGVHKQERPYYCEIDDCIASYKYRGDLSRHIATIHHGIKPFQCQHCDVRFARKSVRDRHTHKKHSS